MTPTCLHDSEMAGRTRIEGFQQSILLVKPGPDTTENGILKNLKIGKIGKIDKKTTR